MFPDVEFPQSDPVYIKCDDTSLRDGFQSVGVKTTLKGELEIAQALLNVGFDVIEAGCPASDKKEMQRIKEIVQMAKGTKSTISSFAKCDEKTIRAAQESLDEAGEGGMISLLTSTSDIHIKAMQKGDSESVFRDAMDDFVKYTRMAANDDRKVLVYLEDATRTRLELMKELIPELIDAGAAALSFPDTNGYVVDPNMYGHVISTARRIADTCGEKGKTTEIVGHTHNDLGLAIANAQAAAANGAGQIQGTITGYGERIGNMAWEVFLYNTIVSEAPKSFNISVGIDISKIGDAVRAFIKHTGIQISPKTPLYGKDWDKTGAGIHAAKLIHDPNTYFAINPLPLGLEPPGDFLVYKRGSGTRPIYEALVKEGVEHVGRKDDRLNEVKDLAYELAAITDEGILPTDVLTALALNFVKDGRAYEIAEGPLYDGTPSQEHLWMKIEDTRTGEEHVIEEYGEGGHVSLVCKGLDKLTGIKMTIGDNDWHSSNVGSGAESPVFINVRMMNGEDYYTGLGLKRDSVTAGISAILRAYNKAVAAKEDPAKPAE